MEYSEVTREKVIVALDKIYSKEDLLALAKELGPHVYAIKVHHVVDCFGPSVVKELKANGVEKVWIDYKLHDTPEGAFDRADALSLSKADIISVHAAGGVQMMVGVKEFFPTVYAVAALTSSRQKMIGYTNGESYPEQLDQLACDALAAQVDAVICPAYCAKFLREMKSGIDGSAIYGKTKMVSPGIRPKGFDAGNHFRPATPAEAIKSGVDKLVIGGPIVQSEHPLKSLENIGRELSKAMP